MNNNRQTFSQRSPNFRPRPAPVNQGQDNGELPNLMALRREIGGILTRVDKMIEDSMANGGNNGGNIHGNGNTRPVTQAVAPVPQTYPEGYDYRGNTAGIREALHVLDLRVGDVIASVAEFAMEDLHDEIRLRTAEARLYQTQCPQGSPEYANTISVLKRLTRLVSEEQPGFVYGLAASHNANWGDTITEVMEKYSPVDLETAQT